MIARTKIKYRSFALVFFLAIAFGFLALAGCGHDPIAPEIVKVEKRVKGPVKVLVGGDFMMDDLSLPFLKKYGYDYPLAKVKRTLLTADIVNINLETPVNSSQECKRSQVREHPIRFMPKKFVDFIDYRFGFLMHRYSYYTTPEVLPSLVDAGVNLVCLANNHALDCGDTSVQTTIDYLNQFGIAHYGAGAGVSGRHRGVVMEVEGVKVGFTGWYNHSVEAGKYGTSKISKHNVITDIKALRDIADVVIVTFHWGKNYARQISEFQEEYGRLAIDHGADVVIGHHPHITQAMEVYKGKPILYSLGNFSFATGNNRASNGFLAGLVIEEGKLTKLEVIPLLLQNRSRRILWQTRIARGQKAKNVLGWFIRYSAKKGAKLKLERNRAVLRLQ